LIFFRQRGTQKAHAKAAGGANTTHGRQTKMAVGVDTIAHGRSAFNARYVINSRRKMGAVSLSPTAKIGTPQILSGAKHVAITRFSVTLTSTTVITSLWWL
jgi:hypothetical protein